MTGVSVLLPPTGHSLLLQPLTERDSTFPAEILLVINNNYSLTVRAATAAVLLNNNDTDKTAATFIQFNTFKRNI